MEKEILEILKAMQQDIKGLKESQERLENKIDGVVEQTADLLEFRTKITDTVQQIKIDVEEIKKDVTNVEVITASNWADIAKLKAVK
jgi:archaellum component FlaC